MTLAFDKDELHPMVDALLRTRVPRWRELNRAIDERDDMLDFAMKLFDHDRDAAVTNYFQSALDQFALVRHISSWREKHPRRMLDFASGYGRLTRLLVHEHLADEVTVADILEGGMAFQAEQFGVRSLVSTTDPARFEAPERYDLIFVASLFTHLPPVTFTSWLRQLADLLETEGLLIFSVHDEDLTPDPVDGIRFESQSESRVLDVEEYGTTWVTEEYVRGQVSAIGADWACVRLPRALSDWQDVYVISPASIAEAKPRRVPKGFLEEPHQTLFQARQHLPEIIRQAHDQHAGNVNSLRITPSRPRRVSYFLHSVAYVPRRHIGIEQDAVGYSASKSEGLWANGRHVDWQSLLHRGDGEAGVT